MRLPHRLQGQKVKSQGGAGAYCGGHLAAQLVIAKVFLLNSLIHLVACTLPTTGTSSDQQKIVTCYQCVTEHRVVNIMVVTV